MKIKILNEVLKAKGKNLVKCFKWEIQKHTALHTAKNCLITLFACICEKEHTAKCKVNLVKCK